MYTRGVSEEVLDCWIVYRGCVEDNDGSFTPDIRVESCMPSSRDQGTLTEGCGGQVRSEMRPDLWKVIRCECVGEFFVEG